MAGFGTKDLIGTPSDAKTIYEAFMHGLKESSNDPFLGMRTVTNKTVGKCYLYCIISKQNKQALLFGKVILKFINE